MPIPVEITALIERFRAQYDLYKLSTYNETQVRREFVDPFFKALGWDVDNEKGDAEAYKDVIHEDSIKIGGVTKAPDYSFRVGGLRKFFVETKKPSVNIKQDTSPAFQLRRYGWSAKLPLAILTDFEEFAVYDCRIRPDKNDRASKSRTLYMRFDEYEDRWSEIEEVFSRESVFKGSFDRYADSSKKKRGTAEVDEAFLAEIEGWRKELARNLALRNKSLEARDLNFAVQKTIDRIIFLRICEDRGIENYGQLQGLAKGSKIYASLGKLFKKADDKYNSGLFHFSDEKTRPNPDEWTLSLEIDDKVLRSIIRNLYYPDSPYEFSVLAADILGQVYEQFLGRIIRLTPSGIAKVEQKPAARKAGGVFYTPTYVVDFIVRETIDPLLKGKEPHEIAGRTKTTWKRSKQRSPLSIIDPSCGSGSFLIGAYQHLLNWYRDAYVRAGSDEFKDRIFQTRSDEWRLTTAERKRILLDHIYGVDIDNQAVEVTKLSLLLKVLEGENQESIDKQMRLFRERALPDLADNIKCGNSLIESDYYRGKQLSLIDTETRLKVNVFDWKGEFPSVTKTGGFDVVIGNPPWGASLGTDELGYLKARYSRVVARMVDTYIYFIDRAILLARPGGPVGFIIPSTILNQVDAEPVRRLLLERGVNALISLGQGIFGRKVLNTSTIFVSAEAAKEINVKDLANVSLDEKAEQLLIEEQVPMKQWRQLVENDTNKTFFVRDPRATILLQKLQGEHDTLESIVDGKIQRGVSPDIAEAHIVSSSYAKSKGLEPELLRPSLSGSSIKRFTTVQSDQLLIYTSRTDDINKFPNVKQHLSQFKSKNTCKEVVQGKHPWWALHRPRKERIFGSPKFIGLTTTKKIELIYDEKGELVVTDAMYVFHVVKSVNPLLVLAVLQSRAFLFFYRVANQGEARVIPQVKASKLYALPFPRIETSTLELAEEASQQTEQLIELRNAKRPRSAQDQILRDREINAVERELNETVYALFGLDGDEVAIIEGMFD